MRRAAILVASTALAAGLLGCGGSEGDTAEQAAPPSAPARAVGTPATSGSVGPEVPAALDFSAPLVDGTEFDARGLAGGTVVFWFWSPF